MGHCRESRVGTVRPGGVRASDSERTPRSFASPSARPGLGSSSRSRGRRRGMARGDRPSGGRAPPPLDALRRHLRRRAFRSDVAEARDADEDPGRLPPLRFLRRLPQGTFSASPSPCRRRSSEGRRNRASAGRWPRASRRPLIGSGRVPPASPPISSAAWTGPSPWRSSRRGLRKGRKKPGRGCSTSFWIGRCVFRRRPASARPRR